MKQNKKLLAISIAVALSASPNVFAESLSDFLADAGSYDDSYTEGTYDDSYTDSGSYDESYTDSGTYDDSIVDQWAKGRVGGNGSVATSVESATSNYTKNDTSSESTTSNGSMADQTSDASTGKNGSIATSMGDATSNYSDDSSVNTTDTAILTFGSDNAGNAVTEDGNATVDYKANISELSGTVTGQGAAVQLAFAEGVPTNTITGSFGGFSGIAQSVQNSGASALTQQQVSFQGNITIN